MAKPVNIPTDESVAAYLDQVSDPQQQKDCYELIELMQKATGQAATMWGSAIIGFGSYHYKYESGREGDWILSGFAPRKNNLAIYVIAGFEPFEELMAKLGKYKTGKSCLYLKRLNDVDRAVLEELIVSSVNKIREEWGS